MSVSRAAEIIALEEALDERLQDHAAVWRSSDSWLEVARQWSAVVWDSAESLGPASLAPDTVERGLALAARPVFVCGAHRSGTSLMRNLLDGHPALAVLPSEGSLSTGPGRQRFGLAASGQAAELGREWLQRLVNPTSQPPFWLLGRTTPKASAYVDFARAFAAWWSILHTRTDRTDQLWPLGAVALAYAARRGGDIAPGISRWVEKTPTSEQFLARLWAEFPAAKVIHVIRQPEAALASRKAVMTMIGRWRPGREVAAIYRDLARSYRLALAYSHSAPADRYLLVRYEDMVALPEEVSRSVAAFLGIAPLETLREPTVAAMPVRANTSFANGRNPGEHALTRVERAMLAATSGRAAARLGYR